MLSNNKIARARSTDEYVDMINQAIDEVFDLRQAIEFDEEFISDGRAVVDQLEQNLKDIYASMKDGSYEFATGDLPYVALLENYRESLIPFKYLLKRINETHNRGLDISES
ncbi:MAG: general secretion pathway protein GspF [Proteobacteria bacterium]|nr:general secretion pathway protein GspF [Pseudomonadota bacterium]